MGLANLGQLIQNADDCNFADDGRLRQLHLECGDDALVSYHNEQGFQPRDLYAMCQVGESSKLAGSGKIGRKGIGFKSVFQITDRPLIISPPFRFCFDTPSRGTFGYIVPSWVDAPEERVPPRHHALLRRLCAHGDDGVDNADDAGRDDGSAANFSGGGGGGGGGGGTLLVCPLTARVRGADLLREFGFDGLSLAFLKNLQKISLVSHGAASAGGGGVGGEAGGGAGGGGGGGGTGGGAAAATTTTQEYRVERTVVFEHGPDDEGQAHSGGFSGAMLRGVSVVSHLLSHCAIVESVAHGAAAATETRREYRLHKYTIKQYRASGAAVAAAAAAASSSSSAAPLSATTTISLAFPVSADLAPQRSAHGELVFAFLPVTAAGFGFALHADFELVASRQEVSDPKAMDPNA